MLAHSRSDSRALALSSPVSTGTRSSRLVSTGRGTTAGLLAPDSQVHMIRYVMKFLPKRIMVLSENLEAATATPCGVEAMKPA